MKPATREVYLRECLKQARYHHFCADAERALNALSPIWSDLEAEPQLEGLDDRLACEILLICGGVVSYEGQMQQKKTYQETAANLLTEAHEIAVRTGDRDLIAESEKQTGLSYWRLGQYDNAVAFFNTALSKYTEPEQLTNSVCLFTQINLLMVLVKINEYQRAKDLLDKILPFIESHEDLWLQNIFYTQAAGIYLTAGNHAAAIPFLEIAVELSKINRNNAFLGNALNNLSLVYLDAADTRLSLEYVNQAIDAYMQLNQIFPLGCAYETKAQILIAGGNLKEALHLIDESIRILEKGENYPELAESLWTRTVILARQHAEDALIVRQFNHLMRICETHLDLHTTEFYIGNFSRLVHIQKGRNFYERSENFRERMLDDALAQCGGLITPTARMLGISHQNTRALCRTYPKTAEKNQVAFRRRRKSFAASSPEKVEETVAPTFAMRLKTARLEHLGLPAGSIVEVQRCHLAELDFFRPAVVCKDGVYYFGYLENALDMYAFLSEEGVIEMTFVASEVSDIGQITGYYDEAAEIFIPLEN